MKDDIKVELIPATINSLCNPVKAENGVKIRVAAYCRVSTDNEEQLTSYTKQKEYYSELINNNDDWELVGIYADEGISGTSTKKRVEFNRMMQDARDGKIDMIITKSISRLSRNTEDTLRYTRELRLLSPPVKIYFEKENLDTFDVSSDFVITILSALAQAESRSISDNVRWSLQKNFQNGKPTINLDRMIGYDMGENGEWIINDEQADIVREIYNMYLCGISASRISKLMNEKKMFTVNGNFWSAETVLGILRNEKFVGDLEMQKTVTVDMLSHTSKKNEGLAPKYYISAHHAPIIEYHAWNRVQNILNKNTFEKTKIKRHYRFAVFSNLMCGVCGSNYKRNRYSSKIHDLSNNETECFFSYPLLKCEQNGKSAVNTKKLKRYEKRCYSEYLHECAIEQSFMEKLYLIKCDITHNKGRAEIVTEYYRSCINKAKREGSLYYKDHKELLERIDSVRNILDQTINNQDQLSDMTEETDTFKELIEEYRYQLAELEERKNIVVRRIVDSDENKKIFDYFLKSVTSLPDINYIPKGDKLDNNTNGIFSADELLPFNRAMYLSFIEYGTVYGDVIEYKTKFGVTLRTAGNMRKPENFIGFRKCDENGNSVIIKGAYQVVGTKLQYRAKKRRRAKPDD